jgi:hypothetical protein
VFDDLVKNNDLVKNQEYGIAWSSQLRCAAHRSVSMRRSSSRYCSSRRFRSESAAFSYCRLCGPVALRRHSAPLDRGRVPRLYTRFPVHKSKFVTTVRYLFFLCKQLLSCTFTYSLGTYLVMYSISTRHSLLPVNQCFRQYTDMFN